MTTDADGSVVIDYGVPITNDFDTDSDGDDVALTTTLSVSFCGETGSATNTDRRWHRAHAHFSR